MITRQVDYHEFWQWLQGSDGYKNSFSLEGAKAIQEHMYELSEDLGEPIEFDPIAWCCEFSEYDSGREAYGEYNKYVGKVTDEEAIEWLQDNTTVIELDNGHIIVGEF